MDVKFASAFVMLPAKSRSLIGYWLAKRFPLARRLLSWPGTSACFHASARAWVSLASLAKC
eukprot:6451879-Pyramimonas_sp.AAC.1